MSSAADRKRAQREREAAGRAMLTVEVDVFELACGLVKHGLLGEWDTENREAIRQATERALAIFPMLRVTRDGDG